MWIVFSVLGNKEKVYIVKRGSFGRVLSNLHVLRTEVTFREVESVAIATAEGEAVKYVTL